jgi:hypothetical protein
VPVVYDVGTVNSRVQLLVASFQSQAHSARLTVGKGC